MSNYRVPRGGPRKYSDNHQHDDRAGGSGREISYSGGQDNYNNRGKYSRGSRVVFSNTRYPDSDFGTEAFNDQGAMRKYGNQAKSNRRSRRGGINYYKPPRGPGPRSHLDEEEDDTMGDESQAGSSQGRRFSPYGGRQRGSRGGNQRGSSQRGYRGSRGNRGGSGGYSSGSSFKPYIGGPNAWFKVVIPHGKKESKDFILRSLLNIVDTPFIPHEFHVDGNNAVFHIQDSAAATALRGASRRITNTQGIKLVVIVTSSRPPTGTSMNPVVLDKLKVCMSGRYDPATKSLSLSSLETDPDLNNEDIRLPFGKVYVAREILKIINENIPELESLDLTHNKLANLSMLLDAPEKAPKLTRLNLSNNNIKHESELDCLKKLQLLELRLEHNPLCDRFPNETLYVSAIRKRFPKILQLDGHDLPPPITFELDTVVKRPDSQGSHFGTNEQVKTLVCQFIQQYFSLYDSSNRQDLMAAYHDQAVFSLIAYRNNVIAKYQAPLNAYYDSSRNLLKMGYNSDQRLKMMKLGRLAIVAQISQLPATQHDLTSFIVDVIHLSSSMLTFSVQGIFREPDSDSDEKRQHIRSFSRIFVTIPQGAGISILNEECTLTNATDEQKKKAFVASVEPAVPTPAVAAAAALTPAQKQQLTQQFSVQSRMNLDWSAKCLQENNWDYDASAKAFTDLQSNGQIPPEAFTST